MFDFIAITSNPNKVKELQHLFTQDLILPGPAELEIEETGETFEDNALLKAQAGLRALGSQIGKHLILAEDSGLCIPSLAGVPGVLSARFYLFDYDAGSRRLVEKPSPVKVSTRAQADRLNNENLVALLRKLGAFKICPEIAPYGICEAYYVSHMLVLDGAEKLVASVEGRCSGWYTEQAFDKCGWAYDHHFLHKQSGHFGLISAKAKARVSHRAEAATALKKALKT